ncbi:MAG: hypothetical protein LBP39_03850, partial [Rickettsiales bacterium]|nr:hypothetical protein [Rickettsiales bacterium]
MTKKFINLRVFAPVMALFLLQAKVDNVFGSLKNSQDDANKISDRGRGSHRGVRGSSRGGGSSDRGGHRRNSTSQYSQQSTIYPNIDGVFLGGDHIGDPSASQHIGGPSANQRDILVDVPLRPSSASSKYYSNDFYSSEPQEKPIVPYDNDDGESVKSEKDDDDKSVKSEKDDEDDDGLEKTRSATGDAENSEKEISNYFPAEIFDTILLATAIGQNPIDVRDKLDNSHDDKFRIWLKPTYGKLGKTTKDTVISTQIGVDYLMDGGRMVFGVYGGYAGHSISTEKKIEAKVGSLVGGIRGGLV